MKTFLIATGLVFSFVAVQAHAVTDIACWDMFSAKGARLVLKAAVVNGRTLADIQLDVKAARFENFFIDETTDLGDLRQHKSATTKSALASLVSGGSKIFPDSHAVGAFKCRHHLTF